MHVHVSCSVSSVHGYVRCRPLLLSWIQMRCWKRLALLFVLHFVYTPPLQGLVHVWGLIPTVAPPLLHLCIRCMNEEPRVVCMHESGGRR